MESAPLDRIHIKDLLVRCVIGIQEWERKTRQDVLISLVLFTNLAQAGQSDSIDDTVNYRTLAKRIIAMAESSSYQLVEAMAEEVARICLESPQVQRVQVLVEKPAAIRFARSVGVEIERVRS